MAIAFESIATTAFTNDTSLVITKPTDLAVGDLMLACVASDEADGFDTPSGWTALVSTSRSSPGAQSENVFYKVADSGDTAASDFTFTPPDQATLAGSILRISGASTNFVTDVGASALAAAVYTGGVTPDAADSLLVITAVGLFQGTTSGYNIVTSDPTWAERTDINHSTNTLAIATAIRAESTATGNFGLTWNTANSSDGILIGIESAFHATTTSTTTSTSTSTTTTSGTSTSSTSSTTTSATSTSSTSSTTTSGTSTSSTSSTTTSGTSSSSSTSSTTTAFPFLIPDISIQSVTPFLSITGNPDE